MRAYYPASHLLCVPRVRVLSLATLAVAFCTSVLYGQDGAGARYVGGTVAAIPADADGRIRTTDEMFFEFRSPKRQVNVEYGSINLIEYGQNVSRRLGLAVTLSPLFLLSKARQHFLTIGYSGADGKQQAMVFRIEKSKIRSVLVALEARTGLKVAYQDDHARKAGKG